MASLSPIPGPIAADEAWFVRSHSILDRATGVALIVGHDDLLDQMRAQRRGRGRRRRDRDVAGAAARRAERAQHARAGKLRRTGHDQRRAGAALVGDLRAARDQRDELFVVERGVAVASGGLDLVAGDAYIGEPQRPHVGRRRIEQQPDLHRAERDGQGRADGKCGAAAGRRVDPGRDVDREHRRRACVEGADRAGEGVRVRARAGAEQSVERDVRAVERGARGLVARWERASDDAASRGLGFGVRACLARIRGGHRIDDAFDLRIDPGERRERVSAVVAGSREGDGAARARRGGPEGVRDPRARVAHQDDLARARAGPRVDGAHLLRRQEAHRRSRITTADAVRRVCVIVRWMASTPKRFGST